MSFDITNRPTLGVTQRVVIQLDEKAERIGTVLKDGSPSLLPSVAVSIAALGEKMLHVLDGARPDGSDAIVRRPPFLHTREHVVPVVSEPLQLAGHHRPRLLAFEDQPCMGWLRPCAATLLVVVKDRPTARPELNAIDQLFTLKLLETDAQPGDCGIMNMLRWNARRIACAQHLLKAIMVPLPAEPWIDGDGPGLDVIAGGASNADNSGDILRRAHRRFEYDVDVALRGGGQELFRPTAGVSLGELRRPFRILSLERQKVGMIGAKIVANDADCRPGSRELGVAGNQDRGFSSARLTAEQDKAGSPCPADTVRQIVGQNVCTENALVSIQRERAGCLILRHHQNSAQNRASSFTRGPQSAIRFSTVSRSAIATLF